MELQFDGFEVKVHGKRGYTPQQAEPGDVGFDLHAPEDIYLPHDCRRMVDTGVIVETPEPLFCLIVPRSSTGTSRAHGVRIANTVGIIDPSYRGEDDTIGVCLEREEIKRDYVGTFTPSDPRMPYWQIKDEAAEHFSLEDENGAATVGMMLEPHKNHETFDVFVFIQHGDEYPLAFEEGDRFVQMIFLPFSRPELVTSALSDFSSDGRGGFGSTGK